MLETEYIKQLKKRLSHHFLFIFLLKHLFEQGETNIFNLFEILLIKEEDLIAEKY